MRLLGLVCIGIAGLSISVASAEKRLISDLTFTTPHFAGKGGSVLQNVSIPEPVIKSGEELSFAELTFNEDLDVRTEVEVWPAIEGDTPPWENPDIVAAFGRNVWVVDERTGSFVKFDVSKIVRAWASEALPNHGLELRVLPDADMEASARIMQATGGVLRYMTQGILKPDMSDPVRKENTVGRSREHVQDGQH